LRATVSAHSCPTTTVATMAVRAASIEARSGLGSPPPPAPGPEERMRGSRAPLPRSPG
jgi:hypothetical protein